MGLSRRQYTKEFKLAALQRLPFISVVDHLRWDLKQDIRYGRCRRIFAKSPAALLFTPRECRRTETRVMTLEEVQQMLSVLDVRERLCNAPGSFPPIFS
jgi:hypothetical protein